MLASTTAASGYCAHCTQLSCSHLALYRHPSPTHNRAPTVHITGLLLFTNNAPPVHKPSSSFEPHVTKPVLMNQLAGPGDSTTLNTPCTNTLEFMPRVELHSVHLRLHNDAPPASWLSYTTAPSGYKKIPHKGDNKSLNQCG